MPVGPVFWREQPRIHLMRNVLPAMLCQRKLHRFSGMLDISGCTTRHTFAAWALTIRVDQNRLVNLMGHASKQMI